LINVVAGLAGQIIGLFGTKGKAQQEALKVRVENMKRSWTDEILVMYWFGPSFIGWVNPAHGIEIQNAMFANTEIVSIQVALTAAVFGLGKLNGRKGWKK